MDDLQQLEQWMIHRLRDLEREQEVHALRGQSIENRHTEVCDFLDKIRSMLRQREALRAGQGGGDAR